MKKSVFYLACLIGLVLFQGTPLLAALDHDEEPTETSAALPLVEPKLPPEEEPSDSREEKDDTEKNETKDEAVEVVAGPAAALPSASVMLPSTEPDEDVIIMKASEPDYADMEDYEAIQMAVKKLRATNPKLADRLEEIARDLAWYVS